MVALSVVEERGVLIQRELGIQVAERFLSFLLGVLVGLHQKALAWLLIELLFHFAYGRPLELAIPNEGVPLFISILLGAFRRQILVNILRRLLDDDFETRDFLSTDALLIILKPDSSISLKMIRKKDLSM